MIDRPKSIQIGVSYRCNIRCKSCLQGAKADGPLMPWELFERILPVVTPGCNVQLFGRGEPLLHPRFLDMVAAVKARGGKSYTVTNGLLLTGEMSRSLADAGLHGLSASVHAADRELHEQLQPGIDSDAVWQNIADCRKAGIDVTLATVVMRSNLEQLLPIAQRGVEVDANAAIWLRMIHDGTLEHEDPLTPALAADTWRYIDECRANLPEGLRWYDNLGPR